jgi:hypothetical protein
MEKEHGRLFFSTRGSQFDWGVLSSIRYGIRVDQNEFGKATEEQNDLACRIDEAGRSVEGQLFSLSPGEAQVAVEAIEQSIELEKLSRGILVNDSTIAAEKALPVIKEIAQTA